jgi:integrase
MRRSAYRRAIEPELGKLKLEEVTSQRLKRLCDATKDKRGPAVAVHVREIVRAVFNHAQGSGLNVNNPAEAIRASSIATFAPRDRALSPAEIRTFLAALEQVATTPTLRLALRFILMTGVRKSEFVDATWAEVDFKSERWTIPAERMSAETKLPLRLPRHHLLTVRVPECEHREELRLVSSRAFSGR